MNVRNIGVFFFFFFFPVLSFADKASISLEAAEALEKEKKYDQAMVIYEEWLKGNAADPRFEAVLRRCADLKRNPAAAVDLYLRHIDSITDSVEKRAVHREIAVLSVLTGDYYAAVTHFEQAFAVLNESTGGDPWLAALSALYIACGENDKAYEWIVKIDPLVKERERRAELNYLLLEIYLVRGETEHAERALSIIAADFGKTAAYPKALFRFGVYCISRGETDRAIVYRDLLVRHFPNAIETRTFLAMLNGKADAHIGLVTGPHELIGEEQYRESLVRETTVDEGSGAPASSPRPAPADKNGWRVQVGSYAVRENAVDLVKELEKRAFRPEIVDAVVNGKTYYRVFVGKALSAEEAQLLLARLQDAGIGGYLYSNDP